MEKRSLLTREARNASFHMRARSFATKLRISYSKSIKQIRVGKNLHCFLSELLMLSVAKCFILLILARTKEAGRAALGVNAPRKQDNCLRRRRLPIPVVSCTYLV